MLTTLAFCGAGLVPGVALAQHAPRAAWVRMPHPSIEGTVDYLWSGDLRRTGDSSIAVFIKTRMDRAVAVVLVEVDCSQRQQRTYAMDAYPSTGGRDSRAVPEPSWVDASPYRLAALCGRMLREVAEGEVTSMFAPGIPARWRPLGVLANGDTLLVDAETFTRERDGAKVWIRTAHPRTTAGTSGPHVAYESVQWEFGCTTRRFRMFGGATYDRQGNVISQLDGAPTPWQSALPESLAETIGQRMCRDDAIPAAPTPQLGPDPD